jgi:hypothetical protein
MHYIERLTVYKGFEHMALTCVCVLVSMINVLPWLPSESSYKHLVILCQLQGADRLCALVKCSLINWKNNLQLQHFSEVDTGITKKKCCSSLCKSDPAWRVVWNKKHEMEKFWMTESILDKNKISKHPAFTRETLEDDGEWFKGSPHKILLTLQQETSKSLSLTQQRNFYNYSHTMSES